MIRFYFLLFLASCPFLAFSQNVHDVIEDDGRLINVPVVFHIIPSTKVLEIGQKISNQIIQDELKELNSNYSAKNDMSNLRKEFRDIIGNPNISFHLKQDENLDAIIRYDEYISPKKLVKKLSDDCLNVLIGNFGSASLVLSEGTKPIMVKVNYKKVGDSSGTLTHEIGHFFGLNHVWGSGNCSKWKNPSRKKRNDYVNDTPFQRNCTDYKGEESCPPSNAEKRPNYNNFMDYSDCRCFFTKDQVQRMRNRIRKYRLEFW